jgi:hypothetical protein
VKKKSSICTETYIFDTYIFGPRTTNHLEGWHNKIKKKVHHAHPNIYLIIEVLQNTQTVTECTIIQYAAGGARPPKRRRYIVIDTRLQLLKER